MTIDWSRPICTKHERPLIGMLLPGVGAGNTRRVAMPSMSQVKPQEHLTVYLYADSGIGRCDGVESDDDLVNFDEMPARAIKLTPDAVRGRA
jgi:hypothetical protein